MTHRSRSVLGIVALSNKLPFVTAHKSLEHETSVW